MNKWHRKSKIQEQVEKEFQQNSWMRFCKTNNPDLYNRELQKVVHNRFIGIGGNKSSFGKPIKVIIYPEEIEKTFFMVVKSTKQRVYFAKL